MVFTKGDHNSYLKKLKEQDPEKLRLIREKALDVKRAKSTRMKTFQELLKGNLEILIGMRDKKTGQLMKDERGNILQITKKELMAINVIDNAIENGNIKDLYEIGKLIGDIQERQDNQTNLIFNSIRNEIEQIKE